MVPLAADKELCTRVAFSNNSRGTFSDACLSHQCVDRHQAVHSPPIIALDTASYLMQGLHACCRSCRQSDILRMLKRTSDIAIGYRAQLLVLFGPRMYYRITLSRLPLTDVTILHDGSADADTFSDGAGVLIQFPRFEENAARARRRRWSVIHEVLPVATGILSNACTVLRDEYPVMKPGSGKEHF